MSALVHFYHLWTGGYGEEIWQEHEQVLNESGFPEEVVKVRRVSDGYEDITLNALREFCRTAVPDTPVFYAHAKGAAYPLYLRCKDTGRLSDDVNARWRQDMTDRLARCWRQRMADLRDHDVVGLYYVEPPAASASHFAGNFWWARAGYIATLPPLPRLDALNRWEAEKWVCSGNPRVKALSRGFTSIPMPPTPWATEVEYYQPKL